MKKQLYILVSLLVLAAFGCTKHESVAPQEPIAKPNLTANDNKDIPRTMSNNEFTTLADFEADPNTYLVSVPQNYQLTMQGIWEFNTAYLLLSNGTNSLVAEIYVGGPNGYVVTNGNECTLKVTSEGPNGICCGSGGSNCSITLNGLSRCKVPSNS